MKVVRLPQALTDLVDTAEYIASEDANVADRFFDAFESAVELIRTTPKIGAVRLFEEQLEIRLWPIKGFEKCLIFYRATDTEIVIVRIIHASRDYTQFFG